MSDLDRRSALLLGIAATAAPSVADARMQSDQSHADDTSETSPAFMRAPNPVEFWSDTSLQLVATDHEVPEQDARAPGPVASARALGLIHIVIADAVAHVYPNPIYRPYLKTSGPTQTIYSPRLFVGGAAAAIMTYIYRSATTQKPPNNPQTSYIKRQRQAFLDQYPGPKESWKYGWDFGNSAEFISRWNWDYIKVRILPEYSTYEPGPQQHSVDPLNPTQRYYGDKWGVDPTPFAITPDEVRRQIGQGGFAPVDPPPIGSPLYNADAEQVRRDGVLHGSTQDPLRTQGQYDPGIFWAYDGARFIGTPPRLYNQFVRAVALEDGLGSRRLARLLALCNVAMSDAGNVAWHAKYTHKVWRPVRGLNPDLGPDPTSAEIEWKPLGSPRTNRVDFTHGEELRALHADVGSATWAEALSPTALGPEVTRGSLCQNLLAGDPRARSPDQAYANAAFTPNFPAYPSGHATLGRACFEILRLFRADTFGEDGDRIRLENFGSDEFNGASIDNFKPEPRAPRYRDFTRVQQAIDLNNDSRIWLGVHWKFDQDEGSVVGSELAKAIFRRIYPEL